MLDNKLRSHKGAGLTKAHIRSKILLRLKTQKEEDRERKSRNIKTRLFKTLVFKRAKRIMFYLSFSGEVDTREMIREAQKIGKIVAVPVCGRSCRSIRASLLTEELALGKGPYGIPEPAIKHFIPIKKLELVVVPGVAFDKQGNRLGRGKGYYDRFLKRLPENASSLGLAFDFQILPGIPTTGRDVSVQRVISA